MRMIFTGFDAREEFGWHAFTSSVIHHAKEAIAFVPISGPQRDGTNAFTYARFLVPVLQKHKGMALFVDGCDMVVRADICNLFDLFDARYAVQVVKHEYKTKHSVKYLGTAMEAQNSDYPRKNWSSVMLMNCEHPAWKKVTDIVMMSGPELHEFRFLKDDEIGDLPVEWGWLADEYGRSEHANLLHFTTGIPAFPAYSKTPHANDWIAAANKVTHTVA